MTSAKPTRARQLGVSDAEYDRLLAAQSGGCAICGNPPKTRRLHVDHDHKSGHVRGLLCYRCNRNLPTYATAQWLWSAYLYVLGWARSPLAVTCPVHKLPVIDTDNGRRCAACLTEAQRALNLLGRSEPNVHA